MLYFAYGSLVNRDQLLRLCPTAKPISTAKITHQALCFTGNSATWGGGTATIGLAPEAVLWGALYQIDMADRDQIERSGLADGYVWSSTQVEGSDGELIQSGILIKVRDLNRTPPSDEYLNVLKAGWAQWGLDLNALLRKIPPTL